MNENGQRASNTGGRAKARRTVGAPAPDSNTDHEVELAVYRQALERARADMQAFAYSVSHDLRAPLRAIQGFSKILIEDFPAQLDEEARQFLQHIVANTQTLAAQMDDLLRFSRAGKGAPVKTTIETRGLVEALIEDLRPDLPPNFRVSVGPLPVVAGDPALLRQALAELIRNAAKFSVGNAAPVAEISGAEDEHAAVLSIRDNGAGFDPAHAGKIFQVFQKLHSPAEFPGHGIGLAIVKRIVEAHGGCVEGHGETGQGATFTIALPRAGASRPLDCVPQARNGAPMAAG